MNSSTIKRLYIDQYQSEEEKNEKLAQTEDRDLD